MLYSHWLIVKTNFSVGIYEHWAFGNKAQATCYPSPETFMAFFGSFGCIPFPRFHSANEFQAFQTRASIPGQDIYTSSVLSIGSNLVLLQFDNLLTCNINMGSCFAPFSRKYAFYLIRSESRRMQLESASLRFQSKQVQKWYA